LNISASGQNIKNLVGNFGVICVGNMHANFQPLSSTGMRGGGDGRKDKGSNTSFPKSLYKFLTPPSLRSGWIIVTVIMIISRISGSLREDTSPEFVL